MSVSHVFIAHSSEDQSIASRILEVLEAEGVRCWIAPRDIPLGTQWAEAILDAIEASSALLLVFSAGSNDSPQVLREVERAVSKRVPIFPVKIDQTEPCRAMEYYLSSHQWKQLFPGRIEDRLSELLPSMKAQLGMDVIERAMDGTARTHEAPEKPRRRLGWALLAIPAAALIAILALGVPWLGRETGGTGPDAVPDTALTPEPVVSSGTGPCEGPVEGMVFARVPGGEFLMGSPGSERGRDEDEGPLHTVTVGPCQIMTTEVTQGTWEAVMGDNPAEHAGSEYPVEQVSWSDCLAFTDSLDALDPGHDYRLPSEAEWEYACRAGSSTRFFWGEDTLEVEIGDFCWYEGNSGEETHAVAFREPNPWGLFDMSGNVLEWCQDCYQPGYAGAPEDGSAWTPPGADSLRVVRGGSSRNSPAGCRSAWRSSYPSGGSSPGIGFRVVRTERDSPGGSWLR
ncbi:SUMF1/EgtB/PvdO family nonheme iron enzyme [Candidatus Fermentibacterales bacterium]|nr:SUMF1/EgtB/PvdO family nonheme iron enzyme [Candidatus Fermentibacterales bacterium]